VEADPGQIEQVLMNLALNARDAMPQGGKLTIETANITLDEAYVETHVGTKAGSYVMLAVTDTGTGMDAETLERVFEPFFTTKETGKGTGLGLAMVYGIVKQHEGNIWAYSEPGQGTTFKVCLPRVDLPTQGLQTTKRQPAKGGSETILILEDEEAVLAIAQRVLTRAGYGVLPARNPEEADALSAQHGDEIALLLTDVVLPGKNGREVFGGLAAQNPALRVLYMSGYTGNAIVHHGVLDTGTPFLAKPFSPDGLLRKVREVLYT